ncbi:MAG: hypothetical protein AAF628_22095 [Planctomycetota bacterium]
MSDASQVPDQDLLGTPLTEPERELVELYRRLEALGARSDLAPCAAMNVRQAMVMMWNACVDLNLVFEEPRGD